MVGWGKSGNEEIVWSCGLDGAVRRYCVDLAALR